MYASNSQVILPIDKMSILNLHTAARFKPQQHHLELFLRQRRELPLAVHIADLVGVGAGLALVVPLGHPVVGAQRGELLLEVVAQLVVLPPQTGAP